MADGDVIRSDIVQIVFDVPENPMKDVNKSVDEMKSNLTKSVSDAANNINKIGTSASSAASDLQKTAQEAQKLKATPHN